MLYNFLYDNDKQKYCKTEIREPSRAEPSRAITLNFFQVYVYLLIIKYYSIYSLKTYSNSFLKLINLSLEKSIILNVFTEYI